MPRTLEDIAAEALEMSVESRAALAYERMWVDEAARRYRQLKDGTAASIASEDVFARLDARVPPGAPDS